MDSDSGYCCECERDCSDLASFQFAASCLDCLSGRSSCVVFGVVVIAATAAAVALVLFNLIYLFVGGVNMSGVKTDFQ